VGNRLPRAADDVCEPLFSCLSLPFERDGAGVNLAAAAGIALCPTHGVNSGELIARADAALDAVSEKGEIGYRFYTGELESHASQRHDRTASIFRAFQDGKFEMRYRVEVECRTQRPEVIRCVPTWRHPERGVVAVNDYQLLVQEAGMLDKFFDWTLAEVVRQKASWRDREWGYLPFALNISAPQLFDVRLAPRIARVLSEFEVEGREFELLFLAEMLQADPENLAPMLVGLKAYGLRLTVDGFAVGAHLLENWRGLPLDNLSLEGGILNGASANHANRLLLTALISLAHGIGLKVNASNIDSEEMLSLLRRLQCDGIRRYRSHTALPPRKIEGLLRRRGLF
ncbi:MAG: GGDEF domain-containing protein, partial [Proteobacteria bacterium]|nr:GGDEF domain-containing protein [Pseudomonadota bacterium]